MASHRWLLLFGVWLLYGSFGLIAASLAPIAALVIEDLKMTHAEMGLAMGAWQLVYIAAAVPAGMLLDRIGGRTALTLGGMLIGFSAIARAYAADPQTLMLAVMLFGLGGPVVSAGAPKVVVAKFEGSTRGLAMGLYMTGPAIGSIISLTVTNPLLLPLLNHSWRNVMLLWGIVAITASFIWFVLASYNTTTPTKTGAGSSHFRAIRNLVAKPTVLIVLAMSVCVFLFNHGLNNWLPEILKSHGMSPIEAGYWAAIPTIIGIAGSLTIPRLAIPERRFQILIILALASLVASLMLRSGAGNILIIGLLLQGLAKSSLMTVLILTLIELPEIGERYAGVASGIFFSAAEVGGVMGPLLLGMLYTPKAGFSSGLWLLTIVAFFMTIGGVALRQKSIAGVFIKDKQPVELKSHSKPE